MSLIDVKWAGSAINIVRRIEKNPSAKVSSYDTRLLSQGFRTISAYIERHGGEDCSLALNYNGMTWLRENIKDIADLIGRAEQIESEVDEIKESLIKDRLSSKIDSLKRCNKSSDSELRYREFLAGASQNIAGIESMKVMHREFKNKHPAEKFPRASFMCGQKSAQIRVVFDDWGDQSVSEKGHRANGEDFSTGDLMRGAKIAGERTEQLLEESFSSALRIAKSEYDGIVLGNKNPTE